MFVKSPQIIKKLFPDLVWEIKTNKKEVYLTFDDGSHPDITPKVLKILDEFGVQATFFCVGENVKKYPKTFNLITSRGHAVGNHTYNHLNGWNTSNSEYFDNIEKAGTLIHSNLFRPPYGRITPSQIKVLKKKFSIVMWTVLTYDFDKKISTKQCFHNSINKVSPGSIIVFHDSLKAANNMLTTLPLFLKYFLDKGWIFKKL